MIKIATENLFLKELGVSDVSDGYVSWLNDPEINKYLESRLIEHTLESTMNFVKETAEKNSSILFGIFKQENMKHIGNIKLGSIDSYHKRAVAGLFIGDKKEWGKGFATEVIRSITKFGFDELGIVKISAACYESNIGSKRAFEKAGYKIEGYFPEHVETASGREGCFQFGIVSK